MATVVDDAIAIATADNTALRDRLFKVVSLMISPHCPTMANFFVLLCLVASGLALASCQIPPNINYTVNWYKQKVCVAR